MGRRQIVRRAESKAESRMESKGRGLAARDKAPSRAPVELTKGEDPERRHVKDTLNHVEYPLPDLCL